MRGALSAILVWLASASGVTAQDVQIDFDTWPDVPCDVPGMDVCERAWVEATPLMPLGMTVGDCGSGRCLEIGWREDQSIREVRVPWAPESPVTTAYVELRVRFGSSYLSETSTTGWANPLYQPLARLRGDVPDEFGVDLAVIHRANATPVVALVSAPDTAARDGVNILENAGCEVDLPAAGEYLTIQAGINLANSGHVCQLTIDGVVSTVSDLSFGGPVAPERQNFASASFLGRVSNEAAGGECAPGWPPCGGAETRVIIVDDLCVSDRIEAGGDGTCTPGGAPVDDAGSGADAGPASGMTFRGVGGCACRASPAPSPTDLGATLLSVLALSISRRRRARCKR